jgi:hypothetical protein
MAEADTTESLKHWLLATAPAVEQTFAQLDHPASALWRFWDFGILGFSG